MFSSFILIRFFETGLRAGLAFLFAACIATPAWAKGGSGTRVSADLYPVNSLVIPSAGMTLASRVAKRSFIEASFSFGYVSLNQIMERTGAPTSVSLPGAVSMFNAEANKAYRDVQRLEIYHATFGAKWRQVWTRTWALNTSFGLGMREMGLSYPVHDISSVDNLSLKLQTRKFGMSTSVGNRWRFDRLFIGLDWAQAFVPFDATFESPSKIREKGSMTEQFNAFSRLPTLSLLVTSFGVAF